MGYRRTILPILSVIFILFPLLTSCEKECCCAPGCTRCDDCWCDCCRGFRGRTVIAKVILPEGASADSYHLSVGKRSYDFWGDTKVIYLDAQHSDVLCYNNDGETVVVERDRNATTHLRYDSDSISYEPNPFYKLASRGYATDVTDTLEIPLKQVTKSYRIITTLLANDKDNRITGCSGIVVSGMAKGIDLWTDACYDRTAYLLQPVMSGNIITASMLSWGRGEGRQTVQYLFRQKNATCLYSADVTEQIARLPQGGDIHVTIDVANDIDTPHTGEGNGGFVVGTDDWNSENTIINI